MRRLDSVFSDFLHEIASDEELTLIFLNELWPRIVGNELAKKARPVGLRNKELIVGVPGEIWQKQLDSLRQMLRQSVNDFWDLPLVEKIQLRIHPTTEGEGRIDPSS